MQKDYIPINKDMIPYTFDILLGGEMFSIRADYNKTADMFTLALSKDGEIVCDGEPIIYGVPLWQDVFITGKYPAVVVIPNDESRDITAVTYDNLNETVFLVIDNGGAEE